MFSDRTPITPVRTFKGHDKKSKSQKYTVICLTVIGLCLVGTGIVLIVLGKDYDIEDLFILGPIFLVAGIGFTIMMFVIIAKPLCEKKARKNKIKHEKRKKPKENKSKNRITTIDNNSLPVIKKESKPYFHDYKEKIKEAEEVNKRLSPSERELYGKSEISKEPMMSDFLPPGAIEIKNEGYTSDSSTDIGSKEIPKSTPQNNEIYGSRGSVHFSLSSNPTPPPETAKVTASNMDYSVISSPIAPLENFNPTELPVYSDEARNLPLPNETEESCKL